MPRNIGNVTTYNRIKATGITIQSNAPNALLIYNKNPSVPEFTFNPGAKKMTINGDLDVMGSATFETINISELSGGMLALASGNPGDTFDIGINGAYKPSGTELYTGIIRDAADTLKRWTFFKNITTPPTTNVVTGITSSNLDSVRMNYIYVNDGTATAPSYTFHNDTGYNTGMFLVAPGELGISAGGIRVIDVKYISPTSTQVSFDSTTAFGIAALTTVDDTASVTVGVTTGHVYIKSLSGADKWFTLYSGTNLGTPSYAGVTFTSPSYNYFMLNTGTSLEIDYNTNVVSSTSSPDFRNGTQQLVVINSSNIQITKPLIIPSGTVGSPAIYFQQEPGTGIYRSGAYGFGIAANGSYMLNITASGTTSAQPIYYPNGTVLSPVISFTSNTGTGIWRDTTKSENISFSANGTSLGYFWLNSSNPQWITAGSGSNAYPSIAMGNDNGTGIYSPTNEYSGGQLSIALQNIEIVRFRGRSGTGAGNTQFFNKTMITPDGTNNKVFIQTTDTRIFNTLKAQETWIQSYNLIDQVPVVLYTFRSANSVGYDYSGNAYNAALIGSPTIAGSFTDSVGVVKKDVLDMTSNTSKLLNLTSNLSAFTSLLDTTISFWFNISGTLSTDNVIFSCYNPGTGKEISVRVLADSNTYANALQVTIQSDSLTTLQYHTATSADSGTPSIISIKDGKWHQVIIHLGSGVASGVIKQLMYLDGTQLTTSGNQIYFTSVGNNPGNPSLSTNSFQDLTFTYVSIGARYNGSVGSLYYTGYLKDFYITGRLVNPTEVTDLSVEPYLYTYGLDVATVKTAQLSLSGAITIPDGTAALPSLSFTSEPSTGILKSSAASHAIGFSLFGTEYMTLASTYLSAYSGTLYFDPSLYQLIISAPTTASSPKLVFNTQDISGKHSIQTIHSSTATSNYIDFYLYDGTNVDGNGLGSNHVARWAVSSAASNSAVYTLYGLQRAYNGTVSLPTYSFTNSVNSGWYLIGAGDVGLTAGGTLRLEANTVITVGNARTDAVTRLYTPIGSSSLPSFSFIGDVTTGIFSSASSNIDFTCASTHIVNMTSTFVSSLVPVTIYNTSTALTVGQTGGSTSGIIFTADSSNSRLGIGYTSYFLSKYDPYNSSASQRFLLDTTSALSAASGLMLMNTSSSFTGNSVSTLSIGKVYSAYNAADIGFYYSGAGSTSNQLQLGVFGVNASQLAIKGDGSVNITGTFTVSSTSAFSGQVQAINGSNTVPSYSFISSNQSGMYYSGSSVALSYTGTKVVDFTASYASFTLPIYLPDGAFSTPSLAFANNTGSGLFNASSTGLGVSTNGVNTWTFNTTGTPHQCLNEIYFTPDGTNNRIYVQSSKFQASSNQTILPITPLLHFKFTYPLSNTSSQDESINKAAILATTATYLSSATPLLSLTDSAGVGLLQYTAAQFISQGNDRIQTSGSISNFSLLQTFNIFVKFKLTSTSSGSLFEIYSNYAFSTSTNFIKLSISSGTLTLSVNGSSALIAATTVSSFSNNTWYSLLLTFNSSGNSITVNGNSVSLSYTTGSSSTQISPSSFTSNANPVVILGGNTSSALGYFAEFYIAPVITTQTVTSLYKIQTHELYTNKIQLGYYTGLADEGYIIRSDKGNNLVWDNSIQIFSTYIQLNSSKTFRLSNGTASVPAYAFSSINDGLFLAGTNTLGFTTNGTQRLSISTSSFNFDSSCTLTINNTTVPTSSTNGAVVIAGGIGLGNGSSTASSINFGSGYTPGSTTTKLIALYDSTGNQNQFNGIGVNTNIFNFQAVSSSTDFVYYVGTSSSTSSEVFRIKGSGVLYGQDGSAAAPTYAFANSIGSGMYRTGTSNNIGLSTSGSQRINIADVTTTINNNLQLSQGLQRSVTVVSGTSVTLDATYNIVNCTYATDTTNVNVTLPAASAHVGREYTIVKTGATASSVVITTNGGDLIDGTNSSITISSQYDRVTLLCIQAGLWVIV